MRQTVRIGTSGWHYKHWKGNFYPAKIANDAMLPYYTQRLDTVEINNCFYRLPTEQAVKAWVEQTPSDFLFALKASRYITHNRKLREPEQSTVRFMKMAEGFGAKLGPILFQFPPSWQVNAERLREFLLALSPQYQYAFEFRHPSWQTEKVYRMLRTFNASLCIFEIAGYRSPIGVTADFVYVRLHGPTENSYQGKYSQSGLQFWAGKIENWTAENRKVHVYFDNDQSGFAAENAVDLHGMLQGVKLRNTRRPA